jgi:ankyrin repeat protein
MDLAVRYEQYISSRERIFQRRVFVKEERRKAFQKGLDEWWNTTDRSKMSFKRIWFRETFDSTVSPLHIAAECGDDVKMELILAAKVEIDCKDGEGDTALHSASTAKCVKLLVEHGFSLESRNGFDMTPLHTAIFSRCPEAAEQLIVCGANVNATFGNESHPPNATGLVTEIPMLDILLTAGCEMTTESFHMQVRHGNLNIVREFLHRGFDVNAVGFKGQTALHFACMTQVSRQRMSYDMQFLIAHLLIENGVKVNAIDDKGNTAWHHINKRSRLSKELRDLLEEQMSLESDNFGFKRQRDLLEEQMSLESDNFGFKRLRTN